MHCFQLSQTLSGRYDAKSFQQTLFNVLRSSSFLSLHAFLILYLACKFRYDFILKTKTCTLISNQLGLRPHSWLSGRFYFPLIACLPGLLSGMAAVQVERSSRRSPLAFYVFNLASQSILTKVRIEMFDQTSNRTLSLIQLFTFAAASTYILQQSQTSGHSRDLVGSLLRWLLGPSIATTDLSSSNIDSCHLTASKHVSISLPARQTLRRLSLAFLRPLAAGASIQLLMQVLLKPALLSNPAGLWNRIASPGFFQVTYFAATYAFLFQVNHCTRTHTCSFNNWLIDCSFFLPFPFPLSLTLSFSCFLISRQVNTFSANSVRSMSHKTFVCPA